MAQEQLKFPLEHFPEDGFESYEDKDVIVTIDGWATIHIQNGHFTVTGNEHIVKMVRNLGASQEIASLLYNLNTIAHTWELRQQLDTGQDVQRIPGYGSEYLLAYRNEQTDAYVLVDGKLDNGADYYPRTTILTKDGLLAFGRDYGGPRVHDTIDGFKYDTWTHPELADICDMSESMNDNDGLLTRDEMRLLVAVDKDIHRYIMCEVPNPQNNKEEYAEVFRKYTDMKLDETLDWQGWSEDI